MRTAPTPGNLVLVVLSALGLAACGGGDGSGGAVTAADCVAGSEQISVVSGDGQVAPPGASLPARLTARVTCENPASRGTMIARAGATVRWTVGSGGLIDGAAAISRQTDSDGLVSAAWTLADRFGTQTVTATVSLVADAPRAVQFNAAAATSTTTAQTCTASGGTDHGFSTRIASNAVWLAAGSPHRGGTIVLDKATLTIEPGAVVCVSAIEPLAGSYGWVAAAGSSQVPIRFFGTAIFVSSELSHVRGENMPVVGTETAPSWFIVDSTFRWTEPRDPLACAQIVVFGSTSGGGTSLRRTLIAGYGSADCAALRLIDHADATGGADPVEVRILGSVGDAVSVSLSPPPIATSPVRFSNCEISSSGRHGIVVTGPTARVAVSGCNLFGNGGDAIANQSSRAIDAPDNWWGDAAGPQGPDGDGVSGAVAVTSPRPAPMPLGY